MRMCALIAATVLSFMTSSAYSQTQQGTPGSPPAVDGASLTTYDRLVDRLKAGDHTVDFTEVRMAFRETPAYTGKMMGFYPTLWGALNARDFEGALKIANDVLQRNYVEPNAHMVAYIAHSQLGHEEQAQFHRFIANGLIRSIFSSGDGNSAKTAYHVIDISEEYAVFRVNNMSVKSAAIVDHQDGAIIDGISLIDNASRAECYVYFRVDNPDMMKMKRPGENR